jgi:uncharacterized protein YpiB (UPF0302 family)
MSQKTYKKINDKTIEESYRKQRTEKVIHNIDDLKKQRDFHKNELERLEEILEAVGEK